MENRGYAIKERETFSIAFVGYWEKQNQNVFPPNI